MSSAVSLIVFELLCSRMVCCRDRVNFQTTCKKKGMVLLEGQFWTTLVGQSQIGLSRANLDLVKYQLPFFKNLARSQAAKDISSHSHQRKLRIRKII